MIILTDGKVGGQPKGLDSHGAVEPVNNVWVPSGKNRQKPTMTVFNPPRGQEWTVRR